VFTSIRWRTATVYTLLILIAIAVMSALFVHFASDFYVDSVRSNLVAQARLVADDLELRDWHSASQRAGMDQLAKHIGQQVGIRLTIIDSSGIVLGDSQENPSAMENHSTRPEVVAALGGQVGSSQRLSATTKENTLYVAVPVESGGAIVGVSRVALPLTAIETSLAGLVRTILLVAGGLVILTVAASLPLSKLTVGPVRQLTAAAERLARGEWQQKVQTSLRDEVADLAGAFNKMADQLSRNMRTLSSEKDKLETVLSNLPDAVMLADSDGRITLINPAGERLLDVTREKALGQHLIEAFRDHEIANVVQECLRDRAKTFGLVETPPGKRLLRIVATPLPTETGPAALVLVQDLTEMRRLETARRDFVANISHELRTPLASIKAVAETLEDGAIEQPEIARKFLASMNREIDELSQMVRELLELSRIESGQTSLHVRPLDVGRLAKHVAERLKPQSERKKLIITVDIPADLPAALADQERTEQVLVNLLHNAVKFTPEGGTISIVGLSSEDELQVRVVDSGIGIPSEDLLRIFERFYKVDRARSSGGTGLGLAIAKHVVQAQGGRIWAESVEGRGSSFSFTLPLAPIETS
jgi:two-component system, OmpR family, phosphate regulon sensor histidine kinase PhoR